MGVAGAVAIADHTAPAEVEVGSAQEATFTFEDLYTDYDSWTLRGETGLTNVTWTVEKRNAGDQTIDGNSYDGQQFNESIALEEDTVTVLVQIQGTVPEITNFTYTPREQFTFASFQMVREQGASEDIESHDAFHYTQDNQAARDAISQAETAIDESGGHTSAEQTLNNAISAYENGNFENAIDLAQQAESTATESSQSQEQRRQLLIGIGILIVLGIVIAAVYWYRKNKTGTKL